jgi:chromosome segregation protein
MFKLQRLEITGFKSFAHHTEIVFTGEGITAVVGPNGCGKSNVADAIAWVLGEQRAKSLRGGEMKDVIFQGSRERAPSGMAEVVLHLVRDETSIEEADIDAIDSTLEEIDDEREAHEAKLALVQSENASNEERGAATAITQNESGPTSEVLETNDLTITDAENNLPVSNVAAVAVTDGQNPAIPPVHKPRHWRPARRAFHFSPGETVTVTRRLYRSGESEYLLNGRACRLRDIQDLFSGTGLAGAHYAIIEQGRIGQILSAKPMDRRTLIEEAAGITKFRVRQRAAEARLEAARANLSRVSDIISEIERQAGSLRRQAAKARRYQREREEMRNTLRRLYAGEANAVRDFLDNVREQLERAEAEEHALAESLIESEEAVRESTARARSLEEELAETRRAAAETELQRDRHERERTYKEEQTVALEKRIADTRAEIESVLLRLHTLEAECATLAEHEIVSRTEAEATLQSLEAAEDAYAARTAEVAHSEAQLDELRASLLTQTGITERLFEIGRQLEAALERLHLQSEGLAREGERAEAAHASAVSEAESVRLETRDYAARLNDLVAEREAAQKELAEARQIAASATDEHARVRDEFVRVRHRLDALTELDRRRAHYSEAVQRIFASDASDEIERKDFHHRGTLADVLRVGPQWERAVEGVFGHFLQAVIVPTPDDAVRAAAWLRHTNFAEASTGRATFLVAGLHGASDEDGENLVFDDGDDSSSIGETTRDDSFTLLSSEAEFENTDELRVGDLLGAPPEIRRILERALPREMNARIAKDLDEAMWKSLQTNQIYTTAEGDCVTGGGLLGAGGLRMADEDAGGLLSFGREMRELKRTVAEFEEQTAIAAKTAEQARARVSELEDSFVLINEAIARSEREQMTRELRLAQLQQEIERTLRHIRVVADDRARLNTEEQDLRARYEASQTEAAHAEEVRRQIADEVSAAADTLSAARRAHEIESERLGQQRAAAAAAGERRRATTAELRRNETEAENLRNQLARYETETTENEARIRELQSSIGEIKENALVFESEQFERERVIEDTIAELNAAREESDRLSAELAEMNRRTASARDARASLEVQRAEASARAGYLRESCMSELAQPLEEILNDSESDVDFDLEAARSRLEEMRVRLENFGAVNMMALEELTEAEERLSFLTTQRQDITDGIGSTEEALREIKRRSRERFRHAFEEINRNFGLLFAELFGGGRGEMSLIEADDILESGIDIIAQPPGKRLQNVLLLSGGEKAMAALALVMSIFQYRPSPFCLLDEVDAPLDEANIGRFTSKIVEMAETVQFIVITHNKKTMEAARALYGVTMEEAGVSKLVSVRFE